MCRNSAGRPGIQNFDASGTPCRKSTFRRIPTPLIRYQHPTTLPPHHARSAQMDAMAGDDLLQGACTVAISHLNHSFSPSAILPPNQPARAKMANMVEGNPTLDPLYSIFSKIRIACRSNNLIVLLLMLILPFSNCWLIVSKL